jgi:thiamine pyrophosphokinase
MDEGVKPLSELYIMLWRGQTRIWLCKRPQYSICYDSGHLNTVLTGSAVKFLKHLQVIDLVLSIL